MLCAVCYAALLLLSKSSVSCFILVLLRQLGGTRACLLLLSACSYGSGYLVETQSQAQTVGLWSCSDIALWRRTH
jgi:hypothetical protein